MIPTLLIPLPVVLLLMFTSLGECARNVPSYDIPNSPVFALPSTTARVLLTQATLWIPFEFKSQAGFVVQHNGVFDTLAVIDAAYQETAEKWKSQEFSYEFAAGAAPVITRIVYFSITLETKLCEKGVRFAVVENGELRGYTIIVNGSIERDELPQIFRDAFWRLYLIIAGKKGSAAWTEEGCRQ